MCDLIEVAADLDQIAHVRAGDEELVARVVDRTLATSRPGRRSRRLAWSLTAAAALVTSVAAAAWWRGGATMARNAPLVAEAAHVAQTSDGTSPAPPGRGRDLDDPPTAVAALPAPSAEQVSRRPSEPVPSGSGAAPAMAHGIAPGTAVARSSTRGASPSGGGDAIAQPDGDTAAAWFRRANAARHAGALSTATSLYSKLQERFPDSEEARLSHVSLGRLLLESGRASDAERQFSSYLAGSDQELTEEAWVGRAESLARLGRIGDERRSWLRLLQGFPASVYAARAKQRVDELDALRP